MNWNCDMTYLWQSRNLAQTRRHQLLRLQCDILPRRTQEPTQQQYTSVSRGRRDWKNITHSLTHSRKYHTPPLPHYTTPHHLPPASPAAVDSQRGPQVTRDIDLILQTRRTHAGRVVRDVHPTQATQHIRHVAIALRSRFHLLLFWFKRSLEGIEQIVSE
jgi:hypothetical protein